MSATSCAFCLHENPAGAKFCNECASPLSLRPCGACDAVNARGATTCHRCRGALAADAPSNADLATQALVAQADETLQALRRELTQATSRTADSAGPGRGVAAVATADSPSFIEAAVSRASPARADVAALPEIQAPLPRGEHFITLDAALSPPAPAVAEPSPLTGNADAVVLRARRGSPALLIAASIAVLALPVGLYAWSNPARLDAWIAQLAARLPGAQGERPAVEAPAGERTPPAAPGLPALPAEPNDASRGPPEATAEPADDEARNAERATGAAPVVEAGDGGASHLSAAELPAAGAAAAGASAATTSASKSATSARSRASGGKSRVRERAKRPRTAPRPAPQAEPVPQLVE